jgi:UDP-N-acetylglucosamine 2-epimerase (non-hydrolysing)
MKGKATTKVLFVFGTRPEAIKLAPVIKKFQSNSTFDTKVCVTAQHREMLDQILSFFEIQPDYDLNLMKPGQNLNDITSDILIKIKDVFDDFLPDFVFVHGDTTTTFATSLSAFYNKIKVCHIEAGLRTKNKQSPFPEELNRVLTAQIAEYHFPPTLKSMSNLILENISVDSILVTGNTVIDALYFTLEKIKDSKSLVFSELNEKINFSKRIILVTGHRRENFGNGFINICLALKAIAEKYEQVEIVFPVHLNPNVQKPVYDILGNVKNIKLISPLPYQSFIWLLNKSDIVLTDSGGIQEEAPSLGKPVFVMRENTERPEAVEAGTVILVGTSEKKIVHEVSKLIDDSNAYLQMSTRHNPYGDGLSSDRILNFLIKKIKDEHK